MIFKKIATLVAAIAAIAAAAAVVVVALAYALYAFALLYLTPAGAAACVAGAAALIAVIVAVSMTLKASPPKSGKAPPEPENLVAKLIDLAKARPLVAVAAAGAVIAVMVRNPKILGPIIAAAFASKTAASPPPDRKP